MNNAAINFSAMNYCKKHRYPHPPLGSGHSTKNPVAIGYSRILAGLLAISLSFSATAGSGSDRHGSSANHFFDYAKVQSASPIIETIEHRRPVETCRDRPVRSKHKHSVTPIILGTIIGAALGNELGHHRSNKRAGAVAGSILGAAIGSDISRQSPHRGDGYHSETQCTTRYESEFEEQVTGYNVEYRYRGTTYYTQTRDHPGKRLQLKLRMAPVPS